MVRTTSPVLIWWALLSAVAVANLVAWSVSARHLRRRLPALDADVARTRRHLLWLGAAYTAGCAFRSWLPMIDAARVCLHDTALSRIAIGRSVATVAELCFAAQFALLLAEVARATGRWSARVVALTLVPLTIVAELFSWTAVLTADHLFHAVENSLWAAGAVAVAIAFASVWPQVEPRSRRFIAAVLVCSGVYVAFMVTLDVPMYVARWQATVAAGTAPTPLGEGVSEILARCAVARDGWLWRDEIPWLSLYFSIAVWISILLAHAPPLRAAAASAPGEAARPRVSVAAPLRGDTR